VKIKTLRINEFKYLIQDFQKLISLYQDEDKFRIQNELINMFSPTKPIEKDS
jgi:hypothetical protein